MSLSIYNIISFYFLFSFYSIVKLRLEIREGEGEGEVKEISGDEIRGKIKIRAFHLQTIIIFY
jgi:hypothetical protein